MRYRRFSITQNIPAPPQETYSGHDIYDIVGAIRDAVTAYSAKLHSSEQEIVNSVTQLGSTVANYPNLFLAPTPRLVGATPKTIRSLLGDGR